MTRSDNGFSNA